METIIKGILRLAMLGAGASCIGYFFGLYFGIGIFCLAWVFMPEIGRAGGGRT